MKLPRPYPSAQSPPTTASPSALSSSAPPLATADRRTAIRDSIMGQMAGCVTPTLVREGGVASLLIITLIGPDSEQPIGLAFLVIQWSLLIRFVTAPRVDHSWRKRFLQRWLLISSVLSAALLAVPLLGLAGWSELAVWIFIGVLAAYFLAMQVGVTAWFPLLSYIVPPRLRGRYFGTMRRAWQITGFGAVILCGMLLGQDPELVDFVWILAAAALLQFGRVLIFARLPDPPPARINPSSAGLRDMVAPLRDGPFLAFVTFALCIWIMQYATMPFVVPFLRTKLAFPASITLYGAGAFGLGSVLSLVRWGNLADRTGTRLVFLLSGLTAVVALLLISTTPTYDEATTVAVLTALGGMILAGAGAAGIGIAYTVRLMAMAPERHASPYLNFCQAAIGLSSGLVAAGIGHLLAILPDDLAFGVHEVSTYRLFFIGLALFVLVVLTYLRRLARLGEPPLGAALLALAGR